MQFAALRHDASTTFKRQLGYWQHLHDDPYCRPISVQLTFEHFEDELRASLLPILSTSFWPRYSSVFRDGGFAICDAERCPEPRESQNYQIQHPSWVPDLRAFNLPLPWTRC